MTATNKKVEDLILIKPKKFFDKRGFFSEVYNKRSYIQYGVNEVFQQDNHSFSNYAWTVRGLHYQSPPHAQGKLVRCGRGSIFDVAVDLRKGSPTYAQWVGYELSAVNGYQVYIPPGFAHGFLTLEPESEIIYKCTDYYAPETEGSLRWNDPELGIKWPIEGETILSDKDAQAPLLRDLDSPFEWSMFR